MIQTLQTVTEYREDLIYPALCRSFENLNIGSDLRAGMKVVIKPNLVMAKNPASSATTHPLVIQSVVRWLRERGIDDITVTEKFRRALQRGAYEPGLPHLRHGYSGTRCTPQQRFYFPHRQLPGRICKPQFPSDYARPSGRLSHQYLQAENSRYDRLFRR